MTTNRGRKDVIRDRMAATGESYNVAARNLKAMKDMGATREAVLTQRWRPADALDVPCPCGGTCEPGERCERCHALHRHVARYPGSATDVETWADRYDCMGCASSYILTVVLRGRPWGSPRPWSSAAPRNRSYGPGSSRASPIRCCGRRAARTGPRTDGRDLPAPRPPRNHRPPRHHRAAWSHRTAWTTAAPTARARTSAATTRDRGLPKLTVQPMPTRLGTRIAGSSALT